MSKRVLICGGRAYSNKAQLTFMLDQMHKQAKFSCVITGAAHGADALAEDWATRNALDIETYPANWACDGKAAGPIRNLKMLAEGKPDLVIAFPGGKGTAHMKKIARAHGIQVVEIPKLECAHD